MSERTVIFRRKVYQAGFPASLDCYRLTEIGDVVDKMVAAKASSVVVVDDDLKPVGIFTERDITRRVVFKADPSQAVSDVMTTPVQSIPEGEYLYFAIARMRRMHLRHMPVVDDDGRLLGMLSLDQAVARLTSGLMDEIDILTREGDLDGLSQIKAAQVDLAWDMLNDKTPTEDIQALLTHINNDLYRRVVDINLSAMKDEGLGDPPVDFSVIVMGSGGRGENYIYPDQDNGFILDDYPDDRHTEIDGWFIQLAERMTADMNRVGLPYCKGFVMATNPLWRKTKSQWKAQTEMWSRKRNTTSLRLCDIFFDFRTVWGNDQAARELRSFVTDLARNNQMFLREMFDDNKDQGTALGWFGRFITEQDNSDHIGEINLKITGTLPLVEAMRLLSLREGIEEISTLERMARLHDKKILGDEEYDQLKAAFLMISELMLRSQLKAFREGRPVSNYLHPKTLLKREKDDLTRSFKAIHRFQQRLHSEFTGEIF